nr:G2/mitotic-specific cyclin S13-7-like isoform X1 [Ipomoea batatas]
MQMEKIEDSDVGDVYNELAVVEYVEDIYKFYKRAAAEGSSRNTYTATLTARRKAACGLNIKLPKEKIEDIDVGDE